MATEQRQVMDAENNPVLDDDGNATFEEVEVDEDVAGHFLKGDDKDMQRLSSATGRALKGISDLTANQKTLTDTLSTLLERLPEKQAPTNHLDTGTQLETLGNELRDKILDGGEGGALALERLVNMVNNGTKEQNQNNLNAADKAIEAFSKQPFYENVKDSAVKNARIYTEQGIDPSVAARLAYSEASSQFQSGVIATVNQNAPNSLNFIKNGKGTAPDLKPKGKLSDAMEQAWQRDKTQKANGKPLFKDKQEWIDQLDIRTKNEHGLV